MHGIGMYCRVKYAYFRMQVESQNLKTEEDIKRGRVQSSRIKCNKIFKEASNLKMKTNWR